MNKILIAFLAACGGGSPDSSEPDASTSSGGQHVVACSGVVSSSTPSYCPHGDCDDSSNNKCTSYASMIPGATSGACNPGETGSYGLLFAKSPQELSSYFYEVVVCNGGSAMLHGCASGFHTDPTGYTGQPGYVCN